MKNKTLIEQSEFIKTFLEGKTTGGDPEATGARMGSFIKRIRKVAPKSGLLQKKEQQASRIAGKMAARASRQSLDKSHASFTAAGGSENSSTEYEGPPLSEQLDFIKTFLEDLDEGKFGDFVSKHKKKLGTAAAGVALAGSMALGGGGDKQKSTKQVKEPTPTTKTIDHSDDADYKGAPGTQNKGNWRAAAYGKKGTKYRDTVDKADRLGGASKAEDDETDRRRGKKPGELGSKSNKQVKRARTSILNRMARAPKK